MLFTSPGQLRGSLGTQFDTSAQAGYFVWFRMIGMGTVSRASDGRGEVVNGTMMGDLSVTPPVGVPVDCTGRATSGRCASVRRGDAGMILPGLLALLAAAAPARDFAEERMLLDRRLETLRRILPDGPSPLADLAHIRQLAEAAKVLRVEATARPPAESGSRGDVAVDVVGFGRFVEVDRFFRSVALSHRLLDVESLTLTATPEDVIKMTAVVRAPFRPLRAPLPLPPTRRGAVPPEWRGRSSRPTTATSPWPSPSRRRSPPFAAPAATRGSSSPSSPRSRATVPWC